jgi:hypothetical protein
MRGDAGSSESMATSVVRVSFHQRVISVLSDFALF